MGLDLVGIGMLVPTKRVRNIMYYWLFIVVDFVSIYFLVISTIYWGSTESRVGWSSIKSGKAGTVNSYGSCFQDYLSKR